MFSRFLPLILIIGLISQTLVLGLATAQSRDGELSLKLFNPGTESSGPAGFTLFDPSVGNSSTTVQSKDGEVSLKLFNPVPQSSGPANFSLFNPGLTKAQLEAQGPATATSGLRISQVYTRGGEAGATYQNDFIEVFNASSSSVDINGWTLIVDTFEGSTNQKIGATFNTSFVIAPGTHLLFRFNGNGSNGQPTPGEFPITNIGLGSTSGTLTLLAPGQGVPSGCPSASAVADLVGYGATSCSEGSPAPVPPSNKSLTRINGGCTDSDNNFNDFALLDPNPRTFVSPLTPCGANPNPTPTPTPTPTSSPTPTPTPTPGTPGPTISGLRITQVYTRGGEAGATYQNDFIEIFNASSSNVDINGWTLIVDTFEGSTNQKIGATFNTSFAIAPGTHLLFRFNGNGGNGQPTPGEFPITNIGLGSTSGTLTLLAPGQGVPSGCPSASAVADLVGYGATACSEGSPAPVPPSNKSLTRINGGCTDTNNNFNDFALLDPNPHTFTSPLTPCGSNPNPTPTPTPNPNPTPTPTPTPTPGPGVSGLRISQVYTRGGEAGATYQNDFIEIFNASSSNVDINGWTLIVDTFEGSTNQKIGATFNTSFAIAPGTHLLFRFNGNGSNGQATPGEFPITNIGLGSTSGTLTLLAPGQGVPSGCPSASAVADLVGYGATTCSEGTPAPVPPSNKSLTRINGGCTDTNNNFNDFAQVDPNPHTFTSPLTPCGSNPNPNPTPTPTPNPNPTPTPTPTPTPGPGVSGLRISQVYTRGGEAGATYQNDFIEVFNASNSGVDINGWTLIVDTFEGSTNQKIGATFNTSFVIAPGTHLLFRFNGNGSNGQPTPGEFPVTNIGLGSTSGTLTLLAPGQGVPSGCPSASAVADLVGYGATACSEGSPAPVPPSNKSLTRVNGGCTDTNNNFNDFAQVDPNPRTFTSPLTPCGAGVPQSFNFMILETPGTNAIDGTAFFVHQHYADFLNREPDPAGFSGWQSILDNCAAGDVRCDRIEVSSAFFRSEEFQTRGYFVYRFYSTLGRIPHYTEFGPDLAKVSGFLTASELEAHKATFVQDFMARPEFTSRFDSLTTPTAYVDGLLQTVGLANHPSRSAWISGLTNGSQTRAQVLRALMESNELYTKYFNQAFVVMQYFGYLRRDPDILYLDWIKTMNQNGGDYRVMINGFVNSTEYRHRFGR